MTLTLNQRLVTRSLTLMLCLILASGCSVTGALKSAKDFLIPPGDRLDWEYLSFLVDEGANNNSPLSV
ncbi:MAG: hypothetical protein ACO328_04960, partial [Burkholderiaceae bacterium]